ncbi:MAG: DUF2946 domain-containing protein [Vibrio sp.]
MLQRFRDTRYQHAISQLALFAILLIYVAPLISMSVVMTRHHPLMTPTSAESSPMMSMSSSDAQSHHGGWCKYCDLLASLHATTSLALTILLSVTGLIYTDTPNVLNRSIDKYIAQHRPRAPPYLVSFRLYNNLY